MPPRRGGVDREGRDMTVLRAIFPWENRDKKKIMKKKNHENNMILIVQQRSKNEKKKN